jgi:hypothetical protein
VPQKENENQSAPKTTQDPKMKMKKLKKINRLAGRAHVRFNQNDCMLHVHSAAHLHKTSFFFPFSFLDFGWFRVRAYLE